MKNLALLVAVLSVAAGCAGADDPSVLGTTGEALESDPIVQKIQAQGADRVDRSAVVVVDAPRHRADGGTRLLHPSDETTRKYCAELGLTFLGSQTGSFGDHENVSKYTAGGGWDKDSNPTYASEVTCALNGGDAPGVDAIVARIRAQGADAVRASTTYLVTGPRHRADGATRFLFPSTTTVQQYCDELGLVEIGDFQTGDFGEHQHVAQYTPSGGWDKNNNRTYVTSAACGRGFF